MKGRLSETIESVKSNAGTRFKDIKGELMPLKPFFQAVKLTVTGIVAIWGLWSASPTVAVVFVSLSILALTLLTPHPVLLFISGVASIGMFFWALLSAERFMPCFLAGALAMAMLRGLKACINAHTIDVELFPTFADNFTEPLRIFTVIAGIYAIAGQILNYEVDSGDISLTTLQTLSAIASHTRTLLGDLLSSPIAAFALVALLMYLIQRKHSSSNTATPAWHFLGLGKKWPRRLTIAALLTASTSVMAVHELDALAHAGLHDFRRQYSRLQDFADGPVDGVFKRELIHSAWTKLDEVSKKRIRAAINNRKAWRTLEEGYSALSEFGFTDQQVESVISTLRAPNFFAEKPFHLGSLAEGAQLPVDLKHVSIWDLGLAVLKAPKTRWDNSEHSQESSDEVKEMDAALQCSIIEIVTNHVKNYQQMYGWLNAHFPGLDQILDSIRDADSEFVIDTMKQTRDKAIARSLESRKSQLELLVDAEGRSAAAHVPLARLEISDRSQRISEESDTIHMAEASLRRQAPQVLDAAMKQSEKRTAVMRLQTMALDKEYPHLHLQNGGFGDREDFLSSPRWAIAATQRSSAQEAKLRNLEKIQTFIDRSQLENIRSQFKTEQRYESLLAELVGREDLIGLKNILGSEFDKYQEIFYQRRRELGAF